MSAVHNNDLRGEARAYQRDKNHTTKWARGVNATPGRKCAHVGPWEDVCSNCAVRPVRGDEKRGVTRAKQFAEKKLSGQATTLARKAFRNDVTDAMDGPLANVSDASSDNDDVHDASTAPLPAEADFMYSYDAISGPGRGNDILSHALTQAVRRFENTETEKLVHKEYDVIDDGKDIYAADAEDDDFELIEHSHLK